MVTNENKILSANTGAEVYAEEFRLSNGNPISFLPSINTHNVASLKDTSFDSLIKHLPVIARNRLGEDRNLWYEELVPHKTLFVTFIGSTGNNNAFDTSLTSNVIQIGANASVGYGLTKFYAL
jgi:CRISPR-associated protein Cmr4